MSENATFEVAVKAFIVKNGKLLMLEEAEGGKWEIPGGRMQKNELQLPLVEIMKREVAEELGTSFIIKPTNIITQWIRPNNPPRFNIFLNGFYCEWISGKPQLSDEHSNFTWVDEAASWKLTLANGYESALCAFWKYVKNLT